MVRAMPERCPKRSTCRNGSAKVRLSELADRQWGVVSQAQVLDLGVGRIGILRWQDERRLHRVYPGVYAVGHASLATEGRLAAALFYAGKGSALDNLTAAWWAGMVKAEPSVVHVSAPGKRRSLPEVRVHCRRKIPRVLHKGLPVTPPTQTLLDIANELEFDDLRRALAEAEYQRLVTLDDVEQALGRGRPGAARLRAALERHRPQLAHTRSRLEEVFVQLIEQHLHTHPKFNVWVAGHRVDAVWRDHNIVVELDSRLAHSTTRAIENDHGRDLDLRAAGFTVLRYTWRQVVEEPRRVVADLRRHGIA
jgi:very-short-patch-repair endonuclease